MMVVVIASMKAKPGLEKKLVEGCIKMAEAVRENEKDCLLYKPYVNPEDPLDVIMVEKYTDEKALEYHMQTPYYKEGMAKLPELLDAPVDILKSYTE